MAVRPYQVKMEPQAHERLKKRAKQLGITIGEMIENLLASFELRMKKAHKTLEANDQIDVSSLDSVEVDTALMKILLTKDYKDEWKPEVKFGDMSDYEPYFTKK